MPPAQFAGGDVVGVEEAAHAVFAAGDADDGHVLDDHRHGRGAEAVGVVGERGLPEHLAGQAVEGDHLGVQRCHEDGVAGDGDAAVDDAAAEAEVVGQLVVVAPIEFAGGGVEREQAVVRRTDVHDAVVDRRGDLELLHRAGGECPSDLEARDVVDVDVVDGRVAIVGVVAAVQQPFLGVGGAGEQVVVAHRTEAVADVAIARPMGRRLRHRGDLGGRLTFRGCRGIRLGSRLLWRLAGEQQAASGRSHEFPVTHGVHPSS